MMRRFFTASSKMHETSRTKAAIVDMDGTILDSIGMWDEIDNEFLTEKRGIPVPHDYTAIISPMDCRETAEYTIKRFSLPDTPEALMAEWDEMAAEKYETELQLMPYAREFLETVKKMGIKLILCTSSPERYYVPALKRLGVYGLFDGFADTAEVGIGKNEPDVYLLAAKKAGCMPNECVVFEDIPEAIMGAKKAGMKTCGVYERRSGVFEEQMRRECSIYVKNLKEAIGAL